MRHKHEKHSLTTLAELNVTPLLDLAFVLLIIFMITAPFLAESADLIIPTSKASRDAVDLSSVCVVSIDKNRRISLEDETVDLAQLAPRLRDLRAEKPEIAVIIRSDREIPVQDVVEIMDVLKGAGITKVGVVTKPDG